MRGTGLSFVTFWYSLGLNDITCRRRKSYQSTETTVHLTLKMTSAQVIQTSVTNDSSFQNYLHPDDHTIRTTDTPSFKPITPLQLRKCYLADLYTNTKSSFCGIITELVQDYEWSLFRLAF